MAHNPQTIPRTRQNDDAANTLRRAQLPAFNESAVSMEKAENYSRPEMPVVKNRRTSPERVSRIANTLAIRPIAVEPVTLLRYPPDWR